MNTYQILIEYVGTNFVGWQIQKNGLSIQEVIQKALKKIIKKKIIIFGSGRTDAGVHAFAQSAHFRTNYNIKDKQKFVKSLNFFLSKYCVSILDIKKRNKNFHARYSAKKRQYKYIIINRISSLSLEKNRAWNIRKKLNISKMKLGLKLLLGKKDFSTFRSSSCNANSPIRTINKASLKKIGENRLEIIFVSQSFLQQQVRSMVGCIKLLGENKWTLKKFKKVIEAKSRSGCAPVAPPYGLYLDKVNY